MGEVYQCLWRIYREINAFFQVRISHFTFYIHLWPIYWLSLVLKVRRNLFHRQTRRVFYFEDEYRNLLRKFCTLILVYIASQPIRL
jgi:hypothetical protein